jgi:fused signal recognition particle receptor
VKWFKRKKKNNAGEAVGAEEVSASELGGDASQEPDDEASDVPVDEAAAVGPEEAAEVIEPEAETVAVESDDVVPEEMPADTGAEKNGNGGLFQRLKAGLAKTRDFLTTDMDRFFAGGRTLDDDLLETLEERLITADMGVETTMEIMDRIAKKASRIEDARGLKAVLKEEILSLIPEREPETGQSDLKPRVVMVVGVNGVGKTTTIGKLAARAKASGSKVLIAAADTFRAAAIEQLAVWAERAGADIVRHKDNADPAAVAYDSITAAASRGSDLVLVDTAGRLHTKVNLMEELKKIKRTIAKVQPDAPHEVLLVLDATTGQNGVSQAKLFNEAIGVTGIALTKLDGTAKGGIVVSICHSLGIPLKYIGVGEGIDDLQDFDPVKFIEALL